MKETCKSANSSINQKKIQKCNGKSIGHIGDSRDSIRNVVNMENGEIKVENVDTSIKDDSQLTIGQIQKGLE